MEFKLIGTALPKMLSDLKYKYHVLVVLAFSSLVVAFISIIGAIVASSHPPTVLAFSTNSEIIEKTELPKPQDDIKQSIKKYIEYRYKWNSKNIVENIKNAESFIGSKSLTTFRSNMANVIKFALERDVEQRVYPLDIRTDLKNQTVFITGDRVTSIQGLKAAGNLNLSLEFESGLRTPKNPWGIYIIKENEGK